MREGDGWRWKAREGVGLHVPVRSAGPPFGEKSKTTCEPVLEPSRYHRLAHVPSSLPIMCSVPTGISAMNRMPAHDVRSVKWPGSKKTPT